MSGNPSKKILILSLYIPWILATAFQGAPDTSYIIAWLGSFFIFYQTWFSSYRYILPDLPVHNQIMRPLFLQQLIFAGFMCCTSIFFYIDTIGYRYTEQLHDYTDQATYELVYLIAKCQRLALLGHAALTTGFLLLQVRHSYERPQYKPKTNIALEVWIIRVGLSALLVSLIMERIPGLAQFSIGLYNAALFCGAVLFVKGITQKKLNYLIWGGSIFLYNVIQSTVSGYKEPIIINFIIVTCLLYPFYKKTIVFVGIPLFIGLFYVLSLYTNVFRQHAWDQQTTVEEARTEAIETLLNEVDEEPTEQTNWDFLTNRFSEINMFTQYVKSTPDQIPYYQTELLENALLSIIPRALWSDKPITEALAMERVYLAEVVDRRSNVSAKTRPVVDGYLSAGALGVFLYMLFIGSISQALNNKAENLFGGYEIGCIIFFNGFFPILWRGESIEFLINSVFWSFVSMLLAFTTLRYFNYLIEIKENVSTKLLVPELDENHPNQRFL